MKAVIVPGPKGRWEVKDVETPRPGPGQVLIRIRASGLCYTDVHITRGDMPAEFPRTLGHEPVGEIAEVGAGVSTRRAGDRVGVPWVQSSCGRCEWCAREKPIVRDMRISVELVLSLLPPGETQESILDDYPDLESDDIRACLAYAHAVIAGDRLDAVPVSGR